jgi:hypothetical protein
MDNDPLESLTCIIPIIEKETHSPLMLDLVATRAIEPDEEVFIDYGE